MRIYYYTSQRQALETYFGPGVSRDPRFRAIPHRRRLEGARFDDAFAYVEPVFGEIGREVNRLVGEAADMRMVIIHINEQASRNEYESQSQR